MPSPLLGRERRQTAVRGQESAAGDYAGQGISARWPAHVLWASLSSLYRRGAYYVDRILKGAKPGTSRWSSRRSSSWSSTSRPPRRSASPSPRHFLPGRRSDPIGCWMGAVWCRGACSKGNKHSVEVEGGTHPQPTGRSQPNNGVNLTGIPLRCIPAGYPRRSAGFRGKKTVGMRLT